MKKIIAIALMPASILALTLVLTACGWHLRGSTQISQEISPLFLSAIDAQGALVTELRSQLKSAHIATVEKSINARYSITIQDELKDKRIAGVGVDALSSAYEITYKVNFEIRATDSELVDKATAISVRSYNYSTTAINSAAQEEVLLEKEMRRELAQQILRRVNAFATHPHETIKNKSRSQ